MYTKQQLVRRLCEAGLAEIDSIRGCSEIEIAQIEAVAGASLPIAYREFMSACGKQAGRFLEDLDIFFPTVLSLRTQAVRILEYSDNDSLNLPKGAFVFSIRYGEQFLFFPNLEMDPSILRYMDGDLTFSDDLGKFSDFIEAEFEMAEEIHKRIKGSPLDF